jgi:pimeloyl-ACP methyl ester carboxylesterase
MLEGIRRFIVKTWIAALGVPMLAALGYLWLILWFVAHQREFQYTPGGARVAPEAVGLKGFAAVEAATGDGERIVAWWAPPPPGSGVVLFLHGTPATLPDTVWRLPTLQKRGFGVMAIDYRGYGGSTGTPSEVGLRADARAAFDFIRTAAPESRIAVFGESLGTGIAVALARERPVAGVLLNAPYASVLRLFELRGPPLPYRLPLTDQFDSEALIGGIGVPLLILHGTADDSVPVTEARRLYAAARDPKIMIEVDGAGHLAAWEGGAEAGARGAPRVDCAERTPGSRTMSRLRLDGREALINRLRLCRLKPEFCPQARLR